MATYILQKYDVDEKQIFGYHDMYNSLGDRYEYSELSDAKIAANSLTKFEVRLLIRIVKIENYVMRGYIKPK